MQVSLGWLDWALFCGYFVVSLVCVITDDYLSLKYDSHSP